MACFIEAFSGSVAASTWLAMLALIVSIYSVLSDWRIPHLVFSTFCED